MYGGLLSRGDSAHPPLASRRGKTYPELQGSAGSRDKGRGWSVTVVITQQHAVFFASVCPRLAILDGMSCVLVLDAAVRHRYRRLIGEWCRRTTGRCRGCGGSRRCALHRSLYRRRVTTELAPWMRGPPLSRYLAMT